MNYLLRKLIDKFIILKTANDETFEGKVIGIFQDALVIKGKRHSYVSPNHSKPMPSHFKIYNIAIGHIIWFEEKEHHEGHSPSTLAKTDDVAIDESIEVMENIEESVEILESLFGTIETLIESEIKNDLKIAPNFAVEFEMKIEEENQES
ncbi:MAG: hypothetical protein ACRCWM_02155 [Sarcina sp.]